MNYYNEFDPKAAEWIRQLIKQGLIPNGTVDERSIAEVQPKDLSGFTQCHFFAGIGGWSRALELAGWPADMPVWTGSCPCQPFSSAGKQKGEADSRHLWPEFRRLVSECRPPAVFGEQVASKLGREWLSGVRADLEGMGYAIGAADLCAAGVGAPHIRQRLYWVAHATGERWIKVGREDSRNHQTHGGGTGDWTSNGGSSGGVGESNGYGRHSRGQASQGLGHRSSVEPAGGSSGLDNAPRNGCQSGAQLHGEHDWKESGGGRVAGFWSNFDIIPCRDGKSRRVESGSFWLVDGIPVGLAESWDACLREVAEKVTHYATETKDDPEQVLRTLRKHYATKAIQWSAGGSDSVPQTALLFAALCELKGKLGDFKHGEAQAVIKASGDMLRGVRQDAITARPPLGQEYPQQLGDQLEDVVRQLPQESSQYLMHSFPLIGKIVGRVGLLRGYGNAIVPQVAAEFIKAFLDLTPGDTRGTGNPMARTKRFNAAQSEFNLPVIRASNKSKLIIKLAKVLSSGPWAGDGNLQIEALTDMAGDIDKRIQSAAYAAAQAAETGSANGTQPE